VAKSFTKTSMWTSVEKQKEEEFKAKTADEKILALQEEDNKSRSFVMREMGTPADFIEYNQMIGNPFSKITNQFEDMADFQVKYHFAINHYHLIEYLKSRKLGATETAIRSISKNVWERYRGHDIMFVAGNQLNTAREILKRFDELFHDKHHEDGIYAWRDTFGNKWEYKEMIRRSALEGMKPIIEFRNDTRAFAFAASKSGKTSSFRGPDDIIAVLLSESAHTGMEDDRPIMDGLLPNLSQRDDADFISETTGNGKRGFFYRYWIAIMLTIAKLHGMSEDLVMSADPVIMATNHQVLVDWIWENLQLANKLDWFPMMTNYKAGLKYQILSQSFIEKMQRDPNVDFGQEYDTQFTSLRSAAFGSLEAENYLPEDEHSEDLTNLLN